MPVKEHTIQLRVRYGETDQMGTFYNSRALDWFECGRTELLRQAGLPYAVMEERGVLLPLTEAHLQFQGRARYDDLLDVTTRISWQGRARLRFDVAIRQSASGQAVVGGHTIHAITDPQGRPMRPPEWLAAWAEKVENQE